MTANKTIHTKVRAFPIDRSKSRNALSLNGIWKVQPTNADSVPSAFHHTIPVPSLVDLASPRYEWNKAAYHWHKLEFSLDGYDTSDVIVLRIGQSQYGTQVWLNDRLIGESISCYTSQEYRVDPWLLKGQSNRLLIRVGAKSALPVESAVGNDQEKKSFIPGIWGDVSLVVTSSTRVKNVQVVPNLTNGSAEASVTIQNLDSMARRAVVRARILERVSGHPSSSEWTRLVDCRPGENILNIALPIDDVKLWSCESPFLYVLRITIESDGRPNDELDTTFGMREFKIVGDHFTLNGKKILLRGGNIAFHRFLGDPRRKGLVWDREWIKKVLVDIPKSHNFNSFRFHLGQAYGAWYDIADEYGILIQNEWQFWRASGTKHQIVSEFTDWLRDNGNHPSIVIWDALNECNEPMVELEVIPLMKDVDRTRPWEPADFRDHHPYIYSLGPVLHDRKFGFAESIEEMERQTSPLVVNEFLWWWLDNDGRPTTLMEGVTDRWLGRSSSKKVMLEHQAWLAQEMVELFRRIGADTIQPFVYLSNGNGPTGNWFLKDISYLHTKPILGALRNAFAPLGVSIELWDRHFIAAEKRQLRIFVFNDHQHDCKAELKVGIVDSKGCWITWKVEDVDIQASSTSVRVTEVSMPNEISEFRIRAEIRGKESSAAAAVSEKPATVFHAVSSTQKQQSKKVVLLDADDEIRDYLRSCDIQPFEWSAQSLAPDRISVIVGQSLRSAEYESSMNGLARIVSLGATLIVIEPELGIEKETLVQVLPDVALKITPRIDADRGGYDSYVFPEDPNNSVWDGIPPSALKLFNGALGGEIVSQHDVIPMTDHTVIARCGLGLNVLAAAQIPYGNGKIVLCRLQVRGRLVPRESAESLYQRRVDPVAQKLLLNLLTL
jgi:beta-galactosidase